MACTHARAALLKPSHSCCCCSSAAAPRGRMRDKCVAIWGKVVAHACMDGTCSRRGRRVSERLRGERDWTGSSKGNGNATGGEGDRSLQTSSSHGARPPHLATPMPLRLQPPSPHPSALCLSGHPTRSPSPSPPPPLSSPYLHISMLCLPLQAQQQGHDQALWPVARPLAHRQDALQVSNLQLTQQPAGIA